MCVSCPPWGICKAGVSIHWKFVAFYSVQDYYTIVFEIPGWVLMFEDQASNSHI